MFQADVNRIKGLLLGHAVGDALGLPVEFSSREELKKHPVTEMRGHGTYDMPAGAWSDDTSMTLCLLDAITHDFRGDYRGLMERFVRWKYEGAFTPTGVAFDIGLGTRKAIARFEHGTDPLECGGNDEMDNGNGALMRIAPLIPYVFVQFGSRLPDGAMELVHDVAALTHRHPRSLIACGIYACIGVQLLRGRSPRKAVWIGYRHAREYYRAAGDAFRKEWKAYDRLRDNDAFAALPEQDIRSSGYVVDTLEAVIWCLLTTSSYESCVERAVNLGEDTDTVGAIAGGLAGLAYGYDSIPKRWLKVLLEREELLKQVRTFEQRLSTMHGCDIKWRAMGKAELVQGMLSCLDAADTEVYAVEWQDRYRVSNYSDCFGQAGISSEVLTHRLEEKLVNQYDEFQCRVVLTILL
ncbi:ADP-ribosylglycohydrolase family protein [uncultured Selenomonas sp.]|uniref:ADP-ribosylglycohydrolase family protein n=1 Tax=uncultured Selenomonas sp. TaxID=159275 RepID=UPI0025D0ED70|nr:ADP-ribosylglycohydrolase family protein [uncultured Selenomonas sp.]